MQKRTSSPVLRDDLYRSATRAKTGHSARGACRRDVDRRSGAHTSQHPDVVIEILAHIAMQRNAEIALSGEGAPERGAFKEISLARGRAVIAAAGRFELTEADLV